MDKRKLNRITWIFVGITVLVVAVMLGNTLRRTTYITLPQTGQEMELPSDTPEISGDALTVVEVRPDTVQAAIATLTRPANYRRSVTVEQFWEGGSGVYETTVTTCNPWTRTDRTMPDGRVRHTVTGEDTVYIWYNRETDVFEAPVGSVSADREQSIPTYEDILELPIEVIAVADYRTISEVDCIYVETAEDEGGYVLRYWVSVDTGLLTVAEKLLAGEPVYRMASLTVEQIEPSVESFTLPDGTILI